MAGVFELIREFDIAPLFECVQIIDVDLKKRHPTRLTVNHLAEVKIPDELMRNSRMGLHLEIRTLTRRDRRPYYS